MNSWHAILSSSLSISFLFIRRLYTISLSIGNPSAPWTIEKGAPPGEGEIQEKDERAIIPSVMYQKGYRIPYATVFNNSYHPDCSLYIYIYMAACYILRRWLLMDIIFQILSGQGLKNIFLIGRSDFSTYSKTEFILPLFFARFYTFPKMCIYT